LKRKRDLWLWIGFGFLALMVLVAILGPYWPRNYLDRSAAPHLGPSAQYWLGTDELGRDLFARLAFGARISLFVGCTVQLSNIVLGLLVGILGVYAPRWVREPLLRLTDGMFAFPDILMGILLIGIFQDSLRNGGNWITATLPVIVALGIAAWPGMARLVRNQVASLKDREFVVAAEATGASKFYIVTRHIVPQLWGLVLAVSMVDLAGTILAESTLSFLGIGVQEPTPSWGAMINTARSDMNSHPLPLLFPCIILSLTIFALNFVGDGLRASLDPRNR